ncbi:MAG TPA: carboxypeptidase-like regulatory domain-containing protein [Vicinamibacterales bacterium]|nr:carboxypeptidase-like regulatory domain-containing protein [Vicinamibacterales bacterium]
MFVSRIVPRGDDSYLGPGGDTVTDQRGEYHVTGLVTGQYAVWGYRDRPPSFDAPKLIANGPEQFALEGGAYPPNTASPCYEPPLALESDRDRSGVDLTWRLEPVTALRGEVRDTNGRPVPGATVQWAPVAIECTGTSLIKTDEDGAFELTRVKRGDYNLDVSWRNSQVVWSGHAPFSSDGRTPQHLALVISSEPAGSVTGRIEFISRREVVTPPGPGVNYSTVFLNSRLFDDRYEIRGVPSTGQRPFVFTGVPSGEYRIHAYAPAGWIVRSALANGRDLLDFPLVIRPGEHTDVVITMSDVFTELTGKVTDARGRPSLDHTVVVFAADEQFWTTMSRRVLVDRPDTHGGFHMTGLPAGEYLVALAPADLENDRPPASMLRDLRASSKRVTLREGVPATLDLRVSAGK